MREKQKLSAIREQTQKARQAQQETALPKSAKVYGPYPDVDKWRVVLRSETGHRVSKTLDSRDEAEVFMRDATHQVEALAAPRTIGEALAEYFADKEAAGLRPLSIRTVRDKPQLRLDDVRQLVELLQREASAGDEGASALLLQLVFGARSSESLGRQVRDINDGDGGRVLWIPDGETKNARRRLSVPEEVQPLLKTLMAQRAPDDFLIGAGRSKPYTSPVLWKRLRRFCLTAGIRPVCPHSLRGLHSTLAIEAGATSGAVIAQRGHSSFQTTERHYVDRDRRHDASMRRVASALLRPRDELQSELADLSADEVRELITAIRSRRSAACPTFFRRFFRPSCQVPHFSTEYELINGSRWTMRWRCR